MYKSLIISSINLQPLSGNLFPSLKEEKKKGKTQRFSVQEKILHSQRSLAKCSLTCRSSSELTGWVLPAVGHTCSRENDLNSACADSLERECRLLCTTTRASPPPPTCTARNSRSLFFSFESHSILYTESLFLLIPHCIGKCNSLAWELFNIYIYIYKKTRCREGEGSFSRYVWTVTL